MKDFAQREDDRALEEFPRMEGFLSTADNLTTEEHLSFSIFQRGEIAALAGLESSECPLHEARDARWQEIWHRGFVYGCREREK